MSMTQIVRASNGKDYSVYRLRKLVASGYISKHTKVSKFPELYTYVADKLTYHSLAHLVRIARKEDLRKTIILDPNGAIVVGILSLFKASMDGRTTIRAVRISTWSDMAIAYYPTHKTSAYMYMPTQHGKHIHTGVYV